MLFEAPTAVGLLLAHIQTVPVPPSRRPPSQAISPALDSVVLRALAKHPDDRFPDATTLAQAVRVAAQRWTTEAGFERAKGEVGIDQYEVLGWLASVHHAVPADAFLEVTRSAAPDEAVKRGRRRPDPAYRAVSAPSAAA